jgi:hypothetical protein
MQAAVNALVPGGKGKEKLKDADKTVRRRRQLLLGVNLYGNVYGGAQRHESVIGHRYLSIMRAHRPTCTWSDVIAEHVCAFDSRRDYTAKKVQKGRNKRNNYSRLYFPSPASLQARRRLAADLGVGIALWEAGQSLPHLVDHII